MYEFTAITDNSLIENTKVEFDLYLRTFIKGTPRHILFCRKDEHFSSERQDELLKKNVSRLFISTRDLGSYQRYQAKHLKYAINDKNKSSQEKSQLVFHVAKRLATDIFQNPKSQENLEMASTWVDNTITHIVTNEDTLSTLFQEKSASYRYYTYTHSINVAVIGLLFGEHLSLAPRDLNCLGKGLLLHDIGKTEIPLDILNKPGNLSPSEFKLMKKHPELGVELLKGKEIEEESLIVVSQHHENYNGSGYPYGLKGKDIHLFGKISRIIDVYDALTTKRTYAKEMRPFAALKEMKEKMINCFDLELLKEFVSFLGNRDPRKTRRDEDILYKS